MSGNGGSCGYEHRLNLFVIPEICRNVGTRQQLAIRFIRSIMHRTGETCVRRRLLGLSEDAGELAKGKLIFSPLRPVRCSQVDREMDCDYERLHLIAKDNQRLSQLMQINEALVIEILNAVKVGSRDAESEHWCAGAPNFPQQNISDAAALF